MSTTSTSVGERSVSSILDELVELAGSADFLGALHRSGQLALAAPAAGGRLAVELGRIAESGPYAAVLALELLAAIRDPKADEVIAELVDHRHPLVRRHATWRAGDRRPLRRALPALAGQLAVGGIDTMHAHRALRRWAASDLAAIARLVRSHLATQNDPVVRARFVDLLGALPGASSDDLLRAIAADPDEPTSSRLAAIGALGERPSDRVDALLTRLVADDTLGAHAALALRDPGAVDVHPDVGADGLRIAQLVMVDGLDGQLSRGGRGDTGGVASLLVSLGEALARRDDVERVVTIGRGSVTDALTAPMSATGALNYGVLPIGDDARPPDSPDALWEHLPAIERGIRRVLRLAGPVDLLHLRMADVGTLAGADVARELGLRVCFSVAPDPHNVVQSLQGRGELDEDTFLRLDAGAHVWFRARLVERLARDADRLALFPRTRSFAFLDELARSDDVDERAAVIAEGIDTSLLRRVAARDADAPDTTTGGRAPGDVLGELAARIPAHRRHLPLLVSVGRLHPVKGMERVVAAWAADAAISASCNLVIVGGDLAAPSPVERRVLDDIDRAVPCDHPGRDGLVLLGGHPHADVAAVLIAAQRGRPRSWAPGGVYVDGALKEEFGLAILEAMAAGLVVVAPSTGGPATYVDDGDTGVLVDPDADLAAAIRDAFALVDRPGRADRARAMVEQHYSVDTMAHQLAELYRPAVALL